MGIICVRYPVTQNAKKIYSSWACDVSHPDILSEFVDRSIRRVPKRIVAMAKQSSGVSYGFVGVRSELQQGIKTFCKKHGISITKFLSCVIEYSRLSKWHYTSPQR